MWKNHCLINGQKDNYQNHAVGHSDQGKTEDVLGHPVHLDLYSGDLDCILLLDYIESRQESEDDVAELSLN